ncbi:GDSL esterase/lipase At3g48460-like [Juglans microcarpa x Juglans regia]|uniref:GDSL esterase/lipase At3g48460-like n=1 Tax=Juglans microcarpa x Juglans regia TaxID=2249226 RepID=UPI001B7E5201|nr:GDSL esterase/lipase At3g48460-like [Juglans microcarpa x Juglans regia]
MADSKYFLRQIAFFILLFSIFSPSSAHNKSTTTTTTTTTTPPSGCSCPCPCPSDSSPPSGSLPPPGSPPSSGSLPPSGSPPLSSGSPPPSGYPPLPSGSPPPSGYSPPSSSQFDFKSCFSRIFAFGDSYTDTGNAQLMGGFQPFISQIFSQFSSGQLPGYRLCNGRLVIDFLCDALSIPTLRPYADSSAEFSKGVNFAIAGSTTLSTDFFSQFISKGHSLMWNANPESCDTQINWFNKYIAEKGCKGINEEACRGEMANSLFWIGEMGGNDYARLYGSHVLHKLLITQAVGHVHKLLRVILDKGARFIVVQGLPPAGCLPLHLSFCPLKDRDQYGCSNIANSLIMAHNELLQAKLEELRRKYSNAMIIYADYWKAYQTILTNYKSYQFEQPFDVCCGAGGGPFNFELNSLCGSAGTSTCKDANKYINWDGIHLTEAMYKHVSDLFFHKDHCRPSFAELIMKKKQMMMGSST